MSHIHKITIAHFLNDMFFCFVLDIVKMFYKLEGAKLYSESSFVCYPFLLYNNNRILQDFILNLKKMFLVRK